MYGRTCKTVKNVKYIYYRFCPQSE